MKPTTTRDTFLSRFNGVINVNDFELLSYNSIESSKYEYDDFYIIQNKFDKQQVGQLGIKNKFASASFGEKDELKNAYLTARYFYDIMKLYNNMEQFDTEMVNLLNKYAAGVKKRKTKKSKKQRKIKKKSKKTFRRF